MQNLLTDADLAFYDLLSGPRKVCGPQLPTLSDFVKIARSGWGIDCSLAQYQEITLICPNTGRRWLTLAWHPLYRGQVQVSGAGADRCIDVIEAISLLRVHQENARHQSLVRLQQARAREWRSLQAEGGRRTSELRYDRKRKASEAHPALWDVRAFA